jgi:hypothetical protein
LDYQEKADFGSIFHRPRNWERLYLAQQAMVLAQFQRKDLMMAKGNNSQSKDKKKAKASSKKKATPKKK